MMTDANGGIAGDEWTDAATNSGNLGPCRYRWQRRSDKTVIATQPVLVRDIPIVSACTSASNVLPRARFGRGA